MDRGEETFESPTPGEKGGSAAEGNNERRIIPGLVREGAETREGNKESWSEDGRQSKPVKYWAVCSRELQA